MPLVGFEPKVPASERAKTVHALDHSATVTGVVIYHETNKIMALSKRKLYPTSYGEPG
jgi:hypothetical protein